MRRRRRRTNQETKQGIAGARNNAAVHPRRLPVRLEAEEPVAGRSKLTGASEHGRGQLRSERWKARAQKLGDEEEARACPRARASRGRHAHSRREHLPDAGTADMLDVGGVRAQERTEDDARLLGPRLRRSQVLNLMWENVLMMMMMRQHHRGGPRGESTTRTACEGAGCGLSGDGCTQTAALGARTIGAPRRRTRTRQAARLHEVERRARGTLGQRRRTRDVRAEGESRASGTRDGGEFRRDKGVGAGVRDHRPRERQGRRALRSEQQAATEGPR